MERDPSSAKPYTMRSRWTGQDLCYHAFFERGHVYEVLAGMRGEKREIAELPCISSSNVYSIPRKNQTWGKKPMSGGSNFFLKYFERFFFIHAKKWIWNMRKEQQWKKEATARNSLTATIFSIYQWQSSAIRPPWRCLDSTCQTEVRQNSSSGMNSHAMAHFPRSLFFIFSLLEGLMLLI